MTIYYPPSGHHWQNKTTDLSNNKSDALILDCYWVVWWYRWRSWKRSPLHFQWTLGKYDTEVFPCLSFRIGNLQMSWADTEISKPSPWWQCNQFCSYTDKNHSSSCYLSSRTYFQPSKLHYRLHLYQIDPTSEASSTWWSSEPIENRF